MTTDTPLPPDASPLEIAQAAIEKARADQVSPEEPIAAPPGVEGFTVTPYGAPGEWVYKCEDCEATLKVVGADLSREDREVLEDHTKDHVPSDNSGGAFDDIEVPDDVPDEIVDTEIVEGTVMDGIHLITTVNDEEFEKLLAGEEEIERKAQEAAAANEPPIAAVNGEPIPNAVLDAAVEALNEEIAWDVEIPEDVPEPDGTGKVFKEPAEGTIKAKILAYLHEHEGQWVSTYALMHPLVGSVDGMRRLREMREAGLVLEARPDQYGTYEYLLPARRKVVTVSEESH